MQQGKTVKEWLEQLPEPYKSEALTMAGIFKTLDHYYTTRRHDLCMINFNNKYGETN